MDQLPVDYFTKSYQYTKTLHTDLYPYVDPSSPALSLEGKVVIVVGASRGIGAKGIIPAFARAGVKGIVLVATDVEKLKGVEATLKEINPKIQTLSIPTKIQDTASVTELYSQVKKAFGHADILVNSAAVNAGGGDIDKEDPDRWWLNFEINTKGAFLLSQGFLKSLPSLESPGVIVSLITGGAWGVFPFMSGYDISKLGTLQLNTNIAAAYPSVTAISIHPGLLDTDMLLPAFQKFDLTSPGLVGGTIVWLCTEKAKFLTGRTVVANWDFEELVQKKNEIEKNNSLKIDLIGPIGPENFQ